MTPLWVWTAVWMLGKRQTAQVTRVNYLAMHQVLNDLARSLPVPTKGLDAWLAKRILLWIDEERARLRKLQMMGVREVGTIQN